VTEDEAQAWLINVAGVSRETFDRLGALRQLVIAESANQNLISASTIDQFWTRHIVDSAQLVLMADAAPDGVWLDLGSGAGFPGMVAALMTERTVVLVESRRKRIDFLQQVADALELANVSVIGARLEMLDDDEAAIISARAFAPLPKLLDIAHRFSRKETVWLLPKGRSASEELETITRSWQGVFHVKPSITDPDASIIVATGVSRRKNRR
jgi:16S rRNA (guanine527-N7)-methyltransferase